jgi:CheY-like chemotaxis protein
MIFVIDDDKIMAECVAKACGEKGVRIFGDALAAVGALEDGLPEMIFMDVMLTGPDGFTMLNELISYPDTMKIPIVIVTAMRLSSLDLSEYGVVGVLNKDTMTPTEIKEYVRKYCR